LITHILSTPNTAFRRTVIDRGDDIEGGLLDDKDDDWDFRVNGD
jgi:hypothetical protein